MELAPGQFADAGFDCYAWLEEVVIDRQGEVAELVQLLPQLALLSQSLSKSIHGSLHQLATSGPQFQAQLDTMQRVTAPLAEELEALATGMGSGAGGNSSAPRRGTDERELQALLTLHDAKTRLQACSKALVQAARWEKNVRACVASIELSLEDAASTPTTGAGGPRAPALAERVREMHQSLEILRDMPGAEDRARTMQRLCAQIESVLRPKLDALLQDAHLPIRPIQSSLAIFQSIGRGELVVQAFAKVRPAQLHRRWYSYSGGGGGSGSGGDDDRDVAFPQWLETFYEEVARMLQRETDHIREIFGPAADGVLLALLENTLTPLRDSYRDRLTKDFALERLIEAFQCACDFASGVAKLFRHVGAAAARAPMPTTTEDQSPPTGEDTASTILTVVFGPYQHFFVKYPELAGAWLSEKLIQVLPQFAPAQWRRGSDGGSAGNPDDDDDPDESTGLDVYVQRLEDASGAISGAIEESFRLCYEFSAGGAFPEAIEVVTQSTEATTTTLVAALAQIRRHLKMTRDHIDNADDELALTHGALEIDWGRFHAALALLRACGTLVSDLLAAEQRLRVRVREQMHTLFGVDGGSPQPSSSSPRHRKKQGPVRAAVTLEGLVERSHVNVAVVFHWLRDETEREKRLMDFAYEATHIGWAESSTLAETKNCFLSGARAALVTYAQQVQTLTFDSVFLPISRVLARLPSNECWTKTQDAELLGDLPSFSTLPQEYITLVADLLLSLLPQLEPFAESSSLHKAAVASQGVERVCRREWERLASALHLGTDEVDECVRIFELEAPPSPNADDREGDVRGSPSSVVSAADFVDLWSGAIASGATAAFVTAVLGIPRLSALGLRQLEADVAYFQNVLSALGGGGERNFVIRGLLEGLQLPDAELAARVERRTAAPRAEGADANEPASQRRVIAGLHQALLAKRTSPVATAHHH